MTKYRDPGFVLANFTLNAHILQMLRNLELITEEELSEVIELALLDLETCQALAPPEDRETFRSARRSLEALRQNLGPQREQRKLKRSKPSKTRRAHRRN